MRGYLRSRPLPPQGPPSERLCWCPDSCIQAAFPKVTEELPGGRGEEGKWPAMSSKMYNQMWHQTQEALNSLLDKESQKIIEPQRNPVFIFQTLATFYIKYVQIFRNLENVYDQIVHPQKRILIRKILDGVMGRILELKSEMVELELSEFHYFDDILQDLKLAPQQLDIPIPKYFLKEKLEVIKGREKILSQILADTELQLSGKTRPAKGISLEEAVKLIQIAERARQGRLRAMFMKQIFLQEHRARHARALGDRIADVGAAALRIQKVWRGFHQCRKTERQREEEMIFLGMVSFLVHRVCIWFS